MPHILLSSRRAARHAGAVVLLASAFAAMAPVHAQGAMPALQSRGTGSFVCGGIGSDESSAMRAAMKQHPLSLLFARPNGDYLADVEVRVKDGTGATAMAFRAGGPVCLIDLPSGSYTIEATSGDLTKTERATVGGAPKTLDFRF